MCPIDPTPHAGEVLQKPEKQFPEPLQDDKHHAGEKHVREDDADASLQDRPPIPAHSELMGVDVEDEEDDPVVESGPGV
jgi:hypothetical protein